MSDNKELTRFERSLFERLSDAGQPVHMLTVQYRMHSIIRKFPSDNFYESKLKDDLSVLNRESQSDFRDFELLSRHFSRIVFYDLEYTKESTNDMSKANLEEAKFTFSLI
jgi:senataxin